MVETLCINGWAQPPDGLSIIAPDALHFDYRAHQNFDSAINELGKIMPTAKRAIGWSLGGSILMKAIMHGQLKVEQLVLIAPSVQFVASPEFTCGMDPWVFRQFIENYKTQPERTSSRFNGLIAKGDAQAKRILAELGTWPERSDQNAWIPWLKQLNEQQFNQWDFSYFPRTLILHGENDSIVSHPQSLWLSKHIPDLQLKLWPNCGHAPHLHDSRGVMNMIDAHALNELL